MNTLIEESEKYLIHSYNRYPVAMDYGENVYLVDTEGKKYLDFGAGIAVCALGYSDEEFKNALKDQIDKATHFSNYFYSDAGSKMSGRGDRNGQSVYGKQRYRGQ